MNILVIGDVVSSVGCEYLRSVLPGVKRLYDVKFTVANGENSAVGNGILPSSAKFLFDSGVDVITSGNHVFKRREIYDYLEETPNLLRPANYPSGAYGKGYTVFDFSYTKIAVINLIGQVFMDTNNCPFKTADEIIERLDTPNIIVDFHAEASGEKGAMGYYLDGRVSAVVGTHTHVQTADEQILPNGTGFITDVGMTGPKGSVLGIKPSCIIQKMTTHMPTRFEVSEQNCALNAILFDIDIKNGKCQNVSRVNMV